jgi:site-specific DNA-cytosine methylase
VENNPHCIQVLKKNFPATAIVLDIVTLQSLPEEIDIVVAGFSCQDLSIEN